MSSESSENGGNVSLPTHTIGMDLTGMSTAGLTETETETKTETAPSFGGMLVAHDLDSSAAFINRLWHALQQR